MEFTTQGRKFVLRGAKIPTPKLVNSKTFAQALQQSAELCFLSLEGDFPQFMLPTCNLIYVEEQHSMPDEILTLI